MTVAVEESVGGIENSLSCDTKHAVYKSITGQSLVKIFDETTTEIKEK